MLWTTEQDTHHLDNDLKVFSNVAVNNDLVPALMAVWIGTDAATRRELATRVFQVTAQKVPHVIDHCTCCVLFLCFPSVPYLFLNTDVDSLSEHP
jgi:hypothetical protein